MSRRFNAPQNFGLILASFQTQLDGANGGLASELQACEVGTRRLPNILIAAVIDKEERINESKRTL